ncbi:hypothetical protein AAFF_G00140960 [Aldrovandia affinis]|uniref:Uncharacterized protein n=1 Tax=Aldrovandia affinis TaxID=143900 RepID=A0AAD7TD07_9TELE|nr:hypothetical protein AAFF_G00140960 [Aldrovandia affinis]
MSRNLALEIAGRPPFDGHRSAVLAPLAANGLATACFAQPLARRSVTAPVRTRGFRTLTIFNSTHQTMRPSRHFNPQWRSGVGFAVDRFSRKARLDGSLTASVPIMQMAFTVSKTSVQPVTFGSFGPLTGPAERIRSQARTQFRTPESRWHLSDCPASGVCQPPTCTPGMTVLGPSGGQGSAMPCTAARLMALKMDADRRGCC